MHRGLRAESVFVDDTGYIKLGGFGNARKYFNSEEAKTKVGLPSQMAPEMLAGQSYTAAIDWWNLGLLLYEMVFNKSPYQGMNEAQIHQHWVKNDISMPTDDSCSVGMKDLIRQLLQKDVKSRLGS